MGCRVAEYAAEYTQGKMELMEDTVSATLFPPQPRVIYQKSPLVEVTMQLRFPPILKIEAELPAAFQDRVRAHFPLLEREPQPGLPPNAPVPAEIAQMFSRAGGTSFRFRSEDEQWTLSLTKGFIALTTLHYGRWEGFREKFCEPLQALVDIYKPAFFTRVGLRYVDIILQSQVGNAPWSQLLMPYVLGELQFAEVENRIQEAGRQVRFSLGEHGPNLLLQHGLGQREESSKMGYVIDFDLYVSEKTEVADVGCRLDDLNKYAGRVFRWCITEKLHKALEPVEVT
jgi:uncharacterized protein (TIGR04255 family)